MMNRIISIFQRLYAIICGVHPRRYPWHAQWLSGKDLYRDLQRVLGTLEGRVLDIGCRNKPYEKWLSRATAHVGIDIAPGPRVDHIIRENERWPLADGDYQAIICTQVIQHVENLPHFMAEMDRVLAPGGIVVLSAPYCYNDMTVRHEGILIKDLWRYSVHGVRALLPSKYETLEARRQGGAGSTVGVLLLNWISSMAATNRATHIVFVLAMPLWIVLSTFVNMIGLLMDKIDRTNSFYHNVLIVARKAQN